MVDFIIKLGGSVLTDKSVEETAKPDSIEESVNILSDAFKAGKRFIVLHGVGSFGHHLASKHGLNKGYKKGDEIIPLVLARIRSSVLKLNRQVVEEFLNRGVPAVTVSTFENWRTSSGHEHEHSTWTIQRLLDDGLLPVLHGDWVFDDVQGCAIMSSDTIMEVLSETFHPKTAIFVMDCGCILTHPPNNPESRPIRRLHVSDNVKDDPTNCLETTSIVPDASGGMKAKLKAAISIFRKSQGSISVVFCKVGQNMKTLCDLKEVITDQSMTELVFISSRDA